jgi:hypothetical protein
MLRCGHVLFRVVRGRQVSACLLNHVVAHAVAAERLGEERERGGLVVVKANGPPPETGAIAAILRPGTH